MVVVFDGLDRTVLRLFRFRLDYINQTSSSLYTMRLAVTNYRNGPGPFFTFTDPCRTTSRTESPAASYSYQPVSDTATAPD